MEDLKQSCWRDGILLSHFTVITVIKRRCAIKVTVKVHLFNNGKTCDQRWTGNL